MRLGGWFLRRVRGCSVTCGKSHAKALGRRASAKSAQRKRGRPLLANSQRLPASVGLPKNVVHSRRNFNSRRRRKCLTRLLRGASHAREESQGLRVKSLGPETCAPALTLSTARSQLLTHPTRGRGLISTKKSAQPIRRLSCRADGEGEHDRRPAGEEQGGADQEGGGPQRRLRQLSPDDDAQKQRHGAVEERPTPVEAPLAERKHDAEDAAREEEHGQQQGQRRGACDG